MWYVVNLEIILTSGELIFNYYECYTHFSPPVQRVWTDWLQTYPFIQF